MASLSHALHQPSQQHDSLNNTTNEHCVFEQLDGVQLSRHNQNSSSNREFSSRKMSMSPYLSPTSKLSSSLSHSPGILSSGIPLRRQMSNKSSLSLAGGAFIYKLFYFWFRSSSSFSFFSILFRFQFLEIC